MEKWKATLSVLLVLSLGGCAKVGREKLAWKMPDRPKAYRDGCVPLSAKQKAICKSSSNEVLEICKRAAHNRIYCDQNSNYLKRLERNWPL